MKRVALEKDILIILTNLLLELGQGIQIELTKGDKNEILLHVSDEGCGISLEELPYILDRFHKTSKKENKSGSGLGLAITKQIAQHHKIEITAASQQYVKTEFIFHFKN